MLTATKPLLSVKCGWGPFLGSSLLTTTWHNFTGGETEALGREGTQPVFLSAIGALRPSLSLGKPGLCPGHSEVPRDKHKPKWQVTSQRHFKQGLPVKDGKMRVWAEGIVCAEALGLERPELVGLWGYSLVAG